MLFNSWAFLQFFAVVYPAYLLLAHRHLAQNALLLAASLFFYGAWDYRFLGLLLLSSGIDFFVAQAVHDARDARKKRLFLVISIIANLTILGFFKYFDFFSASFSALLRAMGMHVDAITLGLVLPIGISFYTFQAMSYVIDVYRGDLEPTRSPLDYALFIAFFPHLVAGPIQRPEILLPQVSRPRTVSWDQINAGVFLIVWGYFKKVVIADNMAGLANPVFDDYAHQHSADLLLGALAFTFQIYGDFSGYSDIARGLAKLMGFDLMVNFRLPYLAVNPSDFWQRWHVSLSTWLRDYLYIPLGGNRGSRLCTYRNIFLTMLLGGLWHGAAWNFVLWGAYHGLLLVGHRIATQGSERRAAPPRLWLLHAGLMFCCTVIGWILFRSKSLHQAIYMVTHLGFSPGERTGEMAYRLAFFVVPLLAVQAWQHMARDLLAPVRRGALFLGAFYGLLLVAIAVFGSRESTEFIYFQF
jgi:D-alanyl-lipoteichoic acid acyltransferase DltB (MBOAT superfamily)